MSSKDLYKVLGVARGADSDAIRNEYRKLARKLHPDVNPGDKAAEAQFKEVSAAYQVLSDPEKRSLYDEFGDVALQASFDKARAEQMRRGGGGGGSFDFRDWSQGFAGGGGGSLEELLARVMGQRFRHAPRKGDSLSTEVHIDLPLAVKGGTTTLLLDLKGREEIEIKIPAGIQDGQSLRLGGLGRPGTGGGAAGDLMVKIRVLSHPCYTREGDDLHVEVPITVAEAVRGGDVRFNGPTGEVTIKIPDGVKSGQSMRLRGLGVGGKGSLYARLVVATPTAPDDPDARQRLEELADELATYYPDDVRLAVRF